MCKESLDSIVAGDKVVLSTMNKMTVLIVSRTTKTKIIVETKGLPEKMVYILHGTVGVANTLYRGPQNYKRKLMRHINDLS